MSWISRSPERALEKIFARITRHGATLKEQGIELMPLRPDPAVRSYFVPRAHTRLRRADFELSLRGMSAVPAIVAAQSDGPVRAVMQEVAEQTCGLAHHYEDMIQSEDVSPYIYVMF